MAASKPTSLPYGTVPSSARQQPSKFELHIEDQQLSNFKQLLRLSPVAKDSYENQQQDRRFGVTREWILNAKKYWENEFNWRVHEKKINSFPNFKTNITDDDGKVFIIHFAALFSEKADAVPIALFHGWPGSFLEFLDLMDLLRNRFSPQELPYHIIAPSLPGYTLSTQPPLDKDWKIADTARIMHKLLIQLGFESGYVVQGGDIGSFVSRTIAATYKECKAMHLNFMFMSKPDNVSENALSELEAKFIHRLHDFQATGNAYGREHGTRPATIGHALASSPVSLLAWIGEKFLEWTDQDLPLDTVLGDITLYWLCESFATSIYTYREDFTTKEKGYFHGQEKLHVNKPMGYSYFPYELAPIPKSWAETTGNLVFFKAHEEGGHFAALEKPKLLLADIEEFVSIAWPQRN
ncbi:epoxide hydrolase 1 [Zopfia rhizophila CBS 207.26]|uniref:Epoxide hydrolase 1 n=1 Tax=Zopfia rhizophila CBS 207.26 TaxID=1314779 RepID=A0A6A6EIG1_9PEZI|nr:epoxide hydrolase 1 [Zopfia rhizophila CBS 207.26]